jgi:hypothetical protein
LNSGPQALYYLSHILGPSWIVIFDLMTYVGKASTWYLELYFSL